MKRLAGTLPIQSQVEKAAPAPAQQVGRAPKFITVIRIDPEKRTCAKIKFKCGKNAVPEVQRLVRSKLIGSYEVTRIIMPGDETPLIVAAGREVGKDLPMWRLKGAEDTAGIGMLFGKGRSGGMVDVPVDIAWVDRMIVWVDAPGEDAE